MLLFVSDLFYLFKIFLRSFLLALTPPYFFSTGMYIYMYSRPILKKKQKLEETLENFSLPSKSNSSTDNEKEK